MPAGLGIIPHLPKKMAAGHLAPTMDLPVLPLTSASHGYAGGYDGKSLPFLTDATSTAPKELMIRIRPFEKKDWEACWRIIEPVFRAGETYAFSPDITESEAHTVWVRMPTATFVAVDDENNILGTYYIKPNQPALGDHVCNCGYIVAENFRSRGIASQMCHHSKHQAIILGFRAMQFNLVVASNATAIRLWEKHGFDVIGTLPQAFRHSRLGFVDALVMYKQLVH
jgi:RimJ/RimL family protein N-acetyltransferase